MAPSENGANTDRRNSTSTLVGVVLLLIAAYSFFRSHVPGTPSHLDLTHLPLQQLDGSPLPAQRVTGRPVVLNVWAPWCGPCRQEMPAFQELQRTHPEITILGVENDPDVIPQAQGLAQRLSLTYPLVQETAPLRHALGSIPALPTTLFLDRRGHVVHTSVGALDLHTMQDYLTDALQP